MRLEYYSDIGRFMNETFDILLENEIENNLLIGNCLKGKEGLDTSKWFMAAVKDRSGTVRLIALMTPPFNLCLCRNGTGQNNGVLDFFARELASQKVAVPGIFAEKSLAAAFSGIFPTETDKKISKITNMRLFQLDQVRDIPISSGRLRQAAEQDLNFLPYWDVHFSLDCGFEGVDVSSSAVRVKNAILSEALYVWEDSYPVSQAGVGRKTPNGAVVTHVYTPPYFRGMGYASSCVAGLSRHLLESGNRFCILFTDLANPVSNSIYMKIGYQPLSDFAEYRYAER